ncbi:hypothetical protein CNMCM8980_003907 [Aspergillus fumigatiaffinis]|uniref:FAD dependent oxidoreductase domain-containing protein n=1 Tax=Aspergillus fumigatiaffinis TaxID=340414 RepID=A0A8H4EGI3_9EURO|nr:hypothetical protein CNMCM5878_001258 [Aspergillus fumigatiaffinis]KAF4222821.1 hypothetical protein CNMCM6457_001137 [Aspergillus fumigatiaffinis]KAF4229779.1 hypothetical protein CNMCM6805_001171 [Aspergillus fumigatiaffinis]KAF4234380.1 hypothetical protein CNMCM8980_003907 [Aspergillus fumigatiaffinis]
MAPENTAAHVAIVGAGVVGLSIALFLSDIGYNVDIVARNFPGDKSIEWSSPWAGALLAPHPDSGFPELQRASLQVYNFLAASEPSSGVRKLKITEFYDDRPEDEDVWYRTEMSNFRQLDRSELAPGSTVGFSYDGLAVNPNRLLPWIMEKLRKNRVTVLQRSIESMEELAMLTGANILINASGLGATQLASDEKMLSIRGQTMFVKTDFDEAVIFQGSQYTYVIPRASDGGVILGGVLQPNDTRVLPDLSLRSDILSRVNAITNGAFSWVDPERDVANDIVGFRPSRKGGFRLERERNTIHAYGFGGLGYLYAFGIAGKVRDMVTDTTTKAKL